MFFYVIHQYRFLVGRGVDGSGGGGDGGAEHAIFFLKKKSLLDFSSKI